MANIAHLLTILIMFLEVNQLLEIEPFLKNAKKSPLNRFIRVTHYNSCQWVLTWSMKMSSGGPSYRETRQVASYCFHSSRLSDPKNPEKAFLPHGHSVGLEIGENAETQAYLKGFLRAQIRAPCPPMLQQITVTIR